jgi:shikimate kinase
VARLVLVGLPGVGKTTLAEMVAQVWGCGALDTDVVLARTVGCAAGVYLRREGVEAFREAEFAALERALESDAVVATGGGVVTNERARALLGREATFWLDCDDETILLRLGDADRPLLDDDPLSSLVVLRAERSAWYEEVSRARIDASGTLEDVMTRILDAAGERDQ